MGTTWTGSRGPVRPAERQLAPDLARGAMLLLIALANAVGVVFASAPGVGPVTNGAERVLNLVRFTLVDARAYPVFAVMFGYGLVQLARRQAAAGASASAVRAVLVRRNLVLIGFGAVHGLLCYFGDFLGAYGIVGVVMAVVLLPRGERVHRLVLVLWALATVELGYWAVRAVRALSGPSVVVLDAPPLVSAVPTAPSPSLAAPDYPSGVLARLTEWPAHTVTVLPFIVIVWLGAWAARRRILEEPSRHLRLLRTVAVVGLGVGVLGGLPLALVAAGWMGVDAPTARTLSMLFTVSGMFAGPGYVAVFGLLSRRLTRANPVVGALSALGRRSLSGYLFQSVAWTVLLMPWSLALAAGSRSPLLVGALVAGAVWLISVLGAAALDRGGRSGPAEWLLRRLTYGPRADRAERALRYSS